MPTFAVNDGLDWTVSKRDLYYYQGDTLQKRTDKFAVVRDDNGALLGDVGPNFEFVQNSDLQRLIDPMVQEGLITIENRGYLSNGGRVFIQSKINQEYRVAGEDHNTYITLLNGHTGNLSVAIGPTVVRVICGNTFAMAYGDLSERYRHESGVTARVLSSKAVLDFVNGAMARYSKNSEALASASCSSSQFQKAMEAVFQKEASKMDNIDKLNNLFYNGAGNEGRTFYDAFNAVTDFNSNVARKSANTRFIYSNFGTGARVNERAMRVLSEMASV
jgi:phage/plasmid-like protein (TIGR03299 family)